MQMQQLGVCAGRIPFSLLLSNNNKLARSNCPSSHHRTAITSFQLQINRLRHHFQISATLQGNITESVAGVKLVKVKFVLQRRCEFGQQFLVVGDDEVFGAWNPEAALPMQWSEGHIWTTELEVSTGKRIEFKVILVGNEGVLEWQPGPNRVLETMESSSPLVVSETWFREDQGDAFSQVEMNELADALVFLPKSSTSIGGVELPIPVVHSEAVLGNIETTDDGALSKQSTLVIEKPTMNLPEDDSDMDKRELSIFEKDLQWARETSSMLWNMLTRNG